MKTKFTNQDLKKIVLKYDLGNLIQSNLIESGNVQTNIYLKTAQGEFVVKYYENKTEEQVLFEIDLLKYLKKYNYPCVNLIENKNKKVIGIYKDKPFILAEYIGGRHVKAINEKQLHEMIKHLAILHKITKDPIRLKNKKLVLRTKQTILNAAKKELKRFKNKEKGKQRFELIKLRLNQLKLPHTLPRGIIHGDFSDDNIKFIGNKISGILDFDGSAYTFLIYDLSLVLFYWTLESGFDFKKANKIIKIYEQYRPLSKLEREHIFDALQFGALMIMAWLMYEKYKGTDLFENYLKILEKLDKVGRNNFYNKIFR